LDASVLDVTVTFATPSLTAVRTPFAETETTLLSSDVYVTAVFNTFSGVNTGVNCLVPPRESSSSLPSFNVRLSILSVPAAFFATYFSVIVATPCLKAVISDESFVLSSAVRYLLPVAAVVVMPAYSVSISAARDGTSRSISRSLLTSLTPSAIRSRRTELFTSFSDASFGDG